MLLLLIATAPISLSACGGDPTGGLDCATAVQQSWDAYSDGSTASDAEKNEASTRKLFACPSRAEYETQMTLANSAWVASIVTVECSAYDPASESPVCQYLPAAGESGAADPVAPDGGEAAASPDPAPIESVSQENARTAAENYLSSIPFSRVGLIKQLEYEGYTKADATYAVDAVSPNWKKQAALKAQTYLDTQSFSRQRLIDQLLYEGFTQNQAEYGVKQTGL